jgi:zinc transport system substrate-binding protein
MKTFVALSIVLCLAACDSGPRDEGLVAGVSLPPQAYLAKRIAGSHAEVLTMLRPGESPATFQPADGEISRILGSRIYFRIRAPFERGKWFQTLQGIGAGRLRIVDATEDIAFRDIAGGGACSACGDHDHDHGHENGHAGRDPHVWLSPAHLATMARTMAAALKEAAPGHSAEFDANLAALEADLDSLNTDIAKLLAPHAGKRFYVYHPAWGYFCDAYGLEQVPIEIEGKEPSDAELSRIQVQMRADAARAIFVQKQFAGPSVEAVANSVGAEVVLLDPLAEDIVAALRNAAQAIAGSLE